MLAAGSIPDFAQRLNPMVVAGLCALSVVVSATAARVRSGWVPAGGDSMRREWHALQGRYFALAHEYRDATAARREAILAEMENTGRAWRRIGFQEL